MADRVAAIRLSKPETHRETHFRATIVDPVLGGFPKIRNRSAAHIDEWFIMLNPPVSCKADVSPDLGPVGP
jgi:hypothetical protein